MATITPEQRLLNVTKVLREAVSSGRHQSRAEWIRTTALQLCDEVEQYVAGELPAIENEEGVPF